MFEEVREPGATGFLVLRADVICEVQMHDGRRMILLEDDREPVRQRGDFVLELRRPHRRDERCGGGQQSTNGERGTGYCGCGASSHLVRLSPKNHLFTTRNPAIAHDTGTKSIADASSRRSAPTKSSRSAFRPMTRVPSSRRVECCALSRPRMTGLTPKTSPVDRPYNSR